LFGYQAPFGDFVVNIFEKACIIHHIRIRTKVVECQLALAFVIEGSCTKAASRCGDRMGERGKGFAT